MPDQNNLPREYDYEAIDRGLDLSQPELLDQQQKQKDLKRAIESRRILNEEVDKPIMVSVSEASKLSGLANRSIRRAIESKIIRFTIKQNRYFIDLRSLIRFMSSTTKRKNKFNTEGLGQYVDKWKG
ncbi:MAG: hypothetical protein V1865_02190 [bacterium]